MNYRRRIGWKYLIKIDRYEIDREIEIDPGNGLEECLNILMRNEYRIEYAMNSYVFISDMHENT